MSDGLPSPSYVIVPYDPTWPGLAEAERELVIAALGVDPAWVQHIGSTAVPGLAAKPIIDLMAGVPPGSELLEWAARLAPVGYEHRGETVPGNLYNRKAVPRRFNLHLTHAGSEFWTENLLFRDYLRGHREAAKEYEAAKREAMAQFSGDPPMYNTAKEPVIRRILREARAVVRGS